ncbi:hypothetical protein BgiMline_025763, partial [Biomphalaria glabrata]
VFLRVSSSQYRATPLFAPVLSYRMISAVSLSSLQCPLLGLKFFKEPYVAAGSFMF